MQTKQTGPAATPFPLHGLLAPALLFLAIAYLLPGLLMILLSVGHPPTLSIDLSVFSLGQYEKVIFSGYYMQVLLQTVVLGVVVGSVTAILGYPAAYYLVRSKSKYKAFLYVLTLIPMAVGMNMITLGWMIVLGREGLINSFLVWLGVIEWPMQLLFSWGTIVVGLTHVLFTFMVLPIASVLKNIDPSVERAARNLGAGPVRTFLHVTLPLTLEGVAAGFLIVFMLSVGALVLPLLLGGHDTMVLPVLIWEQYTVANDRAGSAALAMILLAMALVALLLQQRVQKLREKKVG